MHTRGSWPGCLTLCVALTSACSESYVIARQAAPDALPAFDDIRIETRGDTAIIEFAPVLDAVDYRIYVQPDPDQVSIDATGHQVVRDAIYRCAGKRTVADRADQYGALFTHSLISADNGYARSADEETLGHVFTTPGPDRAPVYRVADPNGHGGYFNAEWIAPLYKEAHSAEYVTDPERRADLLRQGWRDDGIAFYAPDDGDVTVYRVAYQPDAHQGARVSFYFSDGPEHAARTSGDPSTVLDLGARFRVLSAPAPDTVALHRVTYRSGSTFDVLAAGEPAFQRVLHQGGPVTALVWSGLTESTTLVIEALDAGCPFPNAHIGAFAANADTDDSLNARYRSDTLDALRSPTTGEVFVNGQHDPGSRPNPIARSIVHVVPTASPTMDFEATFDDPARFAEMVLHEDSTARVYRNEHWSIETSGCGENLTFGSVLGQLFLGVPQCRLSLSPRGFQPRIETTRFLHVRIATDLPSTARRYPQLLITSARSVETDDVNTAADLVIHNRLGPLAASQLPGSDSSIIVQPHFSYHEAQIQLCSRRGWGPTAPCPRANLYGFNAGDFVTPQSEEPHLPVPVLTDRVGFDRVVQLDVYASTARVYLFVDGQPTGCAILPSGDMPEGEVTVAYRVIADEVDKDELIEMEPGRGYERQYSVGHSDRRVDDFGIDLGVPAPAWDESVLPCGNRWYGGQLIQE